uniref:Uncharacterized protein n=1 Tax=Rhizophora mucronata TaxID=61149 RepID=A0A2P2P8D7_RHIMU
MGMVRRDTFYSAEVIENQCAFHLGK